MVPLERLVADAACLPLTEWAAYTTGTDRWGSHARWLRQRMVAWRAGHLAGVVQRAVGAADAPVMKVLSTFAARVHRGDPARARACSGGACDARSRVCDLCARDVLIWRHATLRVPPLVWRVLGAGVTEAPRADRPRGAVLHVHASEITTFDDLWPALLQRTYRGGPEELEAHLEGATEDDRLDVSWAHRIYNAALLLAHLRARLHGHPDPAAQSRRIGRRVFEGCGRGWKVCTGALDVLDPTLDEAWLFEEVILREALASKDDATKRLVLPYLRVRTALHTALVHDPVEVGLGSYRRCADRVKRLLTWAPLSNLPEARAGRAVARARSEREVDVQALELRAGVPDAVDLAGRLNALRLTASRSPDGIEVGVVASFLRRREGKRGSLKRCAKDYREEAPRLVEALREPGTLLVGLDVAGDEDGEPCWVVAPVLQQVRAELARAGSATRVPLTLHLSETFRGPLTGLRQLAEPLVFGLLQPDDRVSHAIAAGIDIVANARRQSTVLQPAIERLWDLAFLSWAHDRWPDSRVEHHFTELTPYLDAEARKLSIEQLGRRFTLAQLRALWMGLSDGTQWDEFLGGGDRTPALRMFELVLQRHDQPTHIEVPMREAEIRLLDWTQAHLRAEYAKRRITLELNPTSNLLTQGFDVPVAQPGFHPGGYTRITISPDCPRAFATSLSDELLVARAGLHLAGIATVHAEEWIRLAVGRSWTSRFSGPRHRVALD